ncbi:hypothetical protein PG987_012124 [Apiospora arundinis]
MSSTFTRFGSLSPEIRCMIWEEALHDEAGSRYVFVHRTSLKVLPHKPSTRSAIKEATREARDCALKFYDIHLDVWTFAPSVDYDRDIQLFLDGMPWLRQLYYQHPMDMWRGLHGEDKRSQIASIFWQSTFRESMRDLIEHHLKTPPHQTANSQQAGRIFVSSKHDNFVMSSNIVIPQLVREFSIDLCTLLFLRPHHDHFFRVDNRDNWYDSQHMTVEIPSKAFQQIRPVVATPCSCDPDNPHRCGPFPWNTKQWKLGTFKRVEQLYRAVFDNAPTRGLGFGHSYENDEEEDEEDVEAGSATSDETSQS